MRVGLLYVSRKDIRVDRNIRNALGKPRVGMIENLLNLPRRCHFRVYYVSGITTDVARI